MIRRCSICDITSRHSWNHDHPDTLRLPDEASGHILLASTSFHTDQETGETICSRCQDEMDYIAGTFAEDDANDD